VLKKTLLVTEKPWGVEEVWADTAYYKGKFLTINGGHRLSRKYHLSRHHTVCVMTGELTIEAGPTHTGGDITKITLSPNETYHLPSGQIHRFCAEDGPVKIVEVSQAGTTHYVRVEDDYDRITNLPGRIPHSTK